MKCLPVYFKNFLTNTYHWSVTFPIEGAVSCLTPVSRCLVLIRRGLYCNSRGKDLKLHTVKIIRY
jgi:hypothetical protein